MVKLPPGINNDSIKNEVNYVNRGMSFESDINISNKYYIRNNIAIIYKKPTPIKIVKASKSNNSYKINEAYFMSPSTTDYNGIYKSSYIDFEAKETQSTTSFSLSNIHDNQIEHLLSVEEHGGIGFILVRFSRLNMTFLMETKNLKKYLNSDRNSIKVEEFKKDGFEVPSSYNCPVNYIEILDDLYFDL